MLGHRRGGIGSLPSDPRRWNAKHDTSAASSGGSSPSSSPSRSDSASTRSPSVLSRASISPAALEPPPFEVAPRLEHAEHPVELAGQALVPGRRAPLEAGHLAFDAIGLRRGAHAAASGPASRAAGGRHRGFERGDAVFAAASSPSASSIRQPAQARRPRRVGSRAARRERARQLDRGDLADRPAEVVRTESHEVAPDGQREHAVSGRGRGPASARRPCRRAAARARRRRAGALRAAASVALARCVLPRRGRRGAGGTP